MTKEPLGLPIGSVRAIIAIIFSIGLISGLFYRLEKVEVLIAITSTIVGYYFGERMGVKQKENQ